MGEIDYASNSAENLNFDDTLDKKIIISYIFHDRN